MKNFLQQIVETVPFNNFQNILTHFQIEHPENIGGDCTFQDMKLVQLLRAKGYAPEFIFATNFIHPMVICKTEGHLYLFDPSSCHFEPICLDPVLNEHTQVENPSLPVINGHASKIIIRPDEDPNQFTVYRKIYQNGTYINACLPFKFDISNRANQIPPRVFGTLLRTAKSKLHLKVADTSSGHIYMLSKCTGDPGDISAERFGWKNIETISPDDVIGKISELTRIKISELIRIIDIAASKYRELKVQPGI